MVDSVEALVNALRRSRLFETSQLNEIKSKLLPESDHPLTLARRLVQRGWLTSYQATQLLEGQDPELVFGPYHVLSLLGEGGLCQVFKAVHAPSQQVVALKVVHPELRANPDVREQLRQEFQVLAKLSHPAFIKSFETEPSDEQFYFAMEYVEGVDLNRVLQASGLLPMAQACDYIRQAAYGLQYAFEKGLVHRDIKPANLLISFQGDRVRILDIGLGRLEWEFRDDTTVETPAQPGGAALLGTPDYIAPEQALNARSASIRADIYSLGCTLFHLLTGRPPFPGKSLPRKLLEHQTKGPPSVRDIQPELPSELAAHVQKMMAKSPDDRYQTPAGVAVALVPYCQSDEIWLVVEQFRRQAAESAEGWFLESEPGTDTKDEGDRESETAEPATPAKDTDPTKYGGPGQPERRAHPRRSGNPVSVLVSDATASAEPLHAWVLNRSQGGVCLLLDEALELGTNMTIRVDSNAYYPRWIAVRIIYCHAERNSWRTGCQFQEKLSWEALRPFG